MHILNYISEVRPLSTVNLIKAHSTRRPCFWKPLSTCSRIHTRQNFLLQRPKARVQTQNDFMQFSTSASAEQSDNNQNEAATSFMCYLKANELQRSLLLDVLPEGKGQALVVVGVLEGSQADAAGIIPGQKILSISDPIRQDEMWSVGDRPSLRFFKDTLQVMRNKDVTIELSKSALYTCRPSEADESRQNSSPLDLSISSRLSAGVMNNSTVGDKLAEQYKRTASQERQVSEVQKRIARRKEYMLEVSKRSDQGLIGWAVALFVGPAVLILTIAYLSGFLDNMYINSLSAFK